MRLYLPEFQEMKAVMAAPMSAPLIVMVGELVRIFVADWPCYFWG
jgi:hypothetical protein